MKIEIKSIYTDKVLFSHEQNNNLFKITLELAIKAKADLSGAYLSGANLSGADLSGAYLYGANLSVADLSGANLSGAYLSVANLSKTNLSGANLSKANLSKANLYGADLSKTNLSGANLSKANLSVANLSGAYLYGADLSGANLSKASLSGAYLSGADLLCMGDMKFIFTMQLDKWQIGFTKDVLQIGCQRHLIEDWKTFDDAMINSMDTKALGWWKKWKNHIFKTIELCISKGENS